MTKTANPVKFYKILNPDMTPCHGGSGKYHKPVGKRPGKWMPVVDVKPCETGYHTATAGQLTKWLINDAVVWECEPSIDALEHGGVKHVSASVRLLRPVGKLTRNVLVTFAADCADRVLPIFEGKYPADKRPRLAIEAARKGAAADAAYAAAAAASSAYAAAAAIAAAASDAAIAAAEAADASAYAAYASDGAASASANAASAAAYAASSANAANAERTWQGERLLQILSQQNGAK